MIFIGIGGGTVWLQNWKYGESLTLTVFSLTHKFNGPCVSDSWKISLTETLHTTTPVFAAGCRLFSIFPCHTYCLQFMPLWRRSNSSSDVLVSAWLAATSTQIASVSCHLPCTVRAPTTSVFTPWWSAPFFFNFVRRLVSSFCTLSFQDIPSNLRWNLWWAASSWLLIIQIFTFLDPEGGSQKGTLVVVFVVVAISCLTSTKGRYYWTRKSPACLLTLLCHYGKPRLCINIHHYAPPTGYPHWLQQAAAVLVKVQCQV